jgi:hypothetical protein
MAMGYGAMMGKKGGNGPPKSNMSSMGSKPDMMSKGMRDDVTQLPDDMADDDDDMMMAEEYSEEQMSLADDAMQAAKMGDGNAFLRAIHGIMDSYEMPQKPTMMGGNGQSR